MAGSESKKEMDIEMQETGDENVKFIQPNHNGSLGDVDTPKIEFSGLTKEELVKYANDPFWKKVRWVLFIAFWIIWIGMLAAAIIIIVLAPKCPVKHKQDFWEKKVGYWIDPYAFKDSNGDNIGDLQGVLDKIEYVKNDLKSGYIILDSIFYGQFSGPDKYLGAITDFKKIDPALGSEDKFKMLVKEARKNEIEIVLAIDPLSISKSYTTFQKYFLEVQSSLDWKNAQGDKVVCNNGGKRFYASFGSPNGECVLIDVNFNNTEVIDEFKNIVSFWAGMGVRGFLFTNVPYYGKNFSANTEYDSVPNLKTGQIYQESSLNFLREIRKELDAMSANSDKSMLLIADSGNVGFGADLENDKNLMFLGTPKNKAAHLVVSSEFLRGRGWRFGSKYNQTRVSNYIANLPNNGTNPSPVMALTTSTPFNLRTTYAPSIGAAHLLPGAAIAYFASEITDKSDETTARDNDFASGNFSPKNFINYPQSKRTISYSKLSNEVNILAFDAVNRYSMNWDGKQEANYSSYKNSVLRMTAAGRGDTLFQLYRNLAALRVEPSFLWGSVKLIKESDNLEVFVRRADGFPVYIVALIHGNEGSDNVFLEFGDEDCEKAKPVLLYPENPKLPLDKEISTKSIMVKNQPSVNVFKCLK